MSRPVDRLRKYLAVDERLAAVHAVRLSEGSAWTSAVLGVTDRRLLWVGDGDSTTSIDLKYVTAVRSRRLTEPAIRGDDHRLPIVGGGLLAGLCFVGVVVLSTSALVPLLSLVSVGGLAATSYLWRTFDRIQWAPIVGSATVAVAGFLGLLASASSALVPFLVLAAVGGLAVAERVRRRERHSDGIEFGFRHEREVSISTADGRTVHVRCDPSAEVDRALSRLAFVERAEPTAAAQVRS